MKRSLQEIAVEQVFKSLPLKAQRALLPELATSARIATNYAIPECSETIKKFTKWLLTSSRYDSWSEEKITEAWEMFNFLYQRATDSFKGDTADPKDLCVSYTDFVVINGDECYFTDLSRDGISRDEFFSEIIKKPQTNFVVYTGKYYWFDELVMDYNHEQRMKILRFPKEWNHVLEKRTADHLWE